MVKEEGGRGRGGGRGRRGLEGAKVTLVPPSGLVEPRDRWWIRDQWAPGQLLFGTVRDHSDLNEDTTQTQPAYALLCYLIHILHIDRIYTDTQAHV